MAVKSLVLFSSCRKDPTILLVLLQQQQEFNNKTSDWNASELKLHLHKCQLNKTLIFCTKTFPSQYIWLVIYDLWRIWLNLAHSRTKKMGDLMHSHCGVPCLRLTLHSCSMCLSKGYPGSSPTEFTPPHCSCCSEQKMNELPIIVLRSCFLTFAPYWYDQLLLRAHGITNFGPQLRWQHVSACVFLYHFTYKLLNLDVIYSVSVLHFALSQSILPCSLISWLYLLPAKAYWLCDAFKSQLTRTGLSLAHSSLFYCLCFIFKL